MLSQADFWAQVERLQAAFGERNFLEGRMTPLYGFVKALTAGEFQSAITHLIDESPHPPTPAKIKESCRALVDRANQRAQSIAAEQFQKSENHWCEWCGNTGIITANLRSDIYGTTGAHSPYQAFAFRCSKCRAAGMVKAPQGYPVWSDSLPPTFVADKFGPTRGEVYGQANQKRDEVDKMLRRMLAGLSGGVDFD